MKNALLAALLVTASAPAIAQATKDPAKVEAGEYMVDSEHTQVIFSVDHLGFSIFYGRFAHPSGSLTLTPSKPAASTFEITVPTDSVSTPNDKLTGELKSADWLNAAQFPTITFRAASVKPTGSGEAEVTGDLTLHGVTKPLTLHVTLHGAGMNPVFKVYTAGFQATGTLKRSDFGVTKGVPYIGDDVTLTLSGAFLKQ